MNSDYLLTSLNHAERGNPHPQYENAKLQTSTATTNAIYHPIMEHTFNFNRVATKEWSGFKFLGVVTQRNFEASYATSGFVNVFFNITSETTYLAECSFTPLSSSVSSVFPYNSQRSEEHTLLSMFVVNNGSGSYTVKLYLKSFEANSSYELMCLTMRGRGDSYTTEDFVHPHMLTSFRYDKEMFEHVFKRDVPAIEFSALPTESSSVIRHRMNYSEKVLFLDVLPSPNFLFKGKEVCVTDSSVGQIYRHAVDESSTGTGSYVWRISRPVYKSAPPAGNSWLKGDVIYNNNPVPSGNIGWVCTVSGTPGTWKTFGAISA
jgi:hypothetical protein